MEKSKILIFGYGYVAEFLAKGLENFEVISTSRSGKKSEYAKIIDFTLDNLEQELKDVSYIISTIGPHDIYNDPVLYNFSQIIEKAPKLKYIGYISTTSVYGDHNGNWVDEESELKLDNNRGKNRYEAEKAWQKLGNKINKPVIIFRISGIYGPGKNAIEQVKKGILYSIYKKDHKFNRIHIDDIISVIKASISKDTKHNIYNLADNMPAPQYEVIEYASNLLGIEPPQKLDFEKADLSDMAREFYMHNKRISNNKIQKELGIKLKYNNYKEGLKAIID